MRPVLAAALLALALVGVLPTPAISVGTAPPNDARAQADQAVSRLLPWLGATRQAESVVLMEDSQASFVELFALRDIDGDGRDEVLLVDGRETDDGFASQAKALLAPALSDAVWTLDEEDAFLYGLPDVDGDGANDVLGFGMGFGDFSGDYVGAPVVPAGVYTFEGGFSFGGVLRSGRDASELATLLDEYQDETTQAYTGALVAGAYAASSTSSSSSWWFGPSGTILRTTETAQGVSAGAYAVVVGHGAGAYDRDGSAALQSLDGTVLAQYDVTGPEREPVGAMPLANDKGTPGLVVAWRDGVPGAQLPVPLQPTRLHVTAVAGTTVAWEVTEDPGFLLEAEFVTLPDLDGDGVDEVELLLFEFDAQGTGLARASTVLLDGADGSEIARVTSGDRLTVYIPFGDLEGDGSPELLALDLSLSLDDERVAFAVVRADLTPLWSGETAGWPINYPETLLGESSGLADWSGDGAPDLVLREQKGLRALDGRTGNVLWERAVGDDDGVHPIGESTGVGAGDVLVASITGVKEGDDGDDASQAVAAVEAIAGEDGRTLRRQVVRDPASVPAGDAGLDVYARSVGDVDGDGFDEFAVMVVDHVRRTVTQDGESYETSDPVGSAYVFSVRSDLALLALAPQANETSLVPAPELPPAEALALDLASDEAAAEAPVALAVPLGAIAIALLRRRRA